MEFEPLLPDDDDSLWSARRRCRNGARGSCTASAPARRCRRGATGEVEEVLRDLTHISRASVETGADAEEEEQAYAEIVEYVRAGVQLIHDELIELRAAGGDCPTRAA